METLTQILTNAGRQIFEARLERERSYYESRPLSVFEGAAGAAYHFAVRETKGVAWHFVRLLWPLADPNTLQWTSPRLTVAVHCALHAAAHNDSGPSPAGDVLRLSYSGIVRNSPDPGSGGGTPASIFMCSEVAEAVWEQAQAFADRNAQHPEAGGNERPA